MNFHTPLTAKAIAKKELRSDGPWRYAVWAHLSEQDRQKMLQLPGDKFVEELLSEWRAACSRAEQQGRRQLRGVGNLINEFQSEADWWKCGRPYFNVWPILFQLIEGLSLDVPWHRLQMPFASLAVCFPVGKEPYGIACFTVVRTFQGLYLSFQNAEDQRSGNISHLIPQADDETIAKTAANELAQVAEKGQDIPFEERLTAERQGFLLRLVAFIGVLSDRSRQALVQDVVFARDQERYDESPDEALRLRLAALASRMNGRGFHIGRNQQLKYERSGVSPHRRRGHWQGYWVGKGRAELSVKWIEEIEVLASKVCEIPTGMLGPESAKEMAAARSVFPRVPIGLRQRFYILRRDEYRCQLCGRAAGDGVALEIDHKNPVSCGGDNDEENLWVLCFDCNRGRSNLPLTDIESE